MIALFLLLSCSAVPGGGHDEAPHGEASAETHGAAHGVVSSHDDPDGHGETHSEGHDDQVGE